MSDIRYEKACTIFCTYLSERGWIGQGREGTTHLVIREKRRKERNGRWKSEIAEKSKRCFLIPFLLLFGLSRAHHRAKIHIGGAPSYSYGFLVLRYVLGRVALVKAKAILIMSSSSFRPSLSRFSPAGIQSAKLKSCGWVD